MRHRTTSLTNTDLDPLLGLAIAFYPEKHNILRWLTAISDEMLHWD